MSNKVNIDGVEYDKLEIVSMDIDGEQKDKVTFEDTEQKDRITVNMVVKQKPNDSK